MKIRAIRKILNSGEWMDLITQYDGKRYKVYLNHVHVKTSSRRKLAKVFKLTFTKHTFSISPSTRKFKR